MSRTPSKTPHECELELGPRGSLRVTSANYLTVRKWCTAMGLPGKYTAGLAYAQLAYCYNGRNGNLSLGIEYHKGLASNAGIVATDEDEAIIAEPNETGEARVEDAATVTPIPTSTQNDAGKALADLVGPYIGQTLTRDVLKRVNAVLDQRLADITTTRIELVKQDGTVVKVDGHKHNKFDALLRAMSARMANGRHPSILVVGPTGSGKTHGVEQATTALEKPFFSNGAITMDHQLVGFKDANGNYHSTALRDAFGIAATYLFDEIDSSDNSPLLCLAGALANNGFRFPDSFVDRHPDSNIIACANTWGLGGNADFVGRNKLDAAIRSRFPVRIYWDYDEKLERDICGNADWAIQVQKARAAARRAGLKVVIDPRMSQAGAALIAGGATFQEAADQTYLADLTKEQREMVAA